MKTNDDRRRTVRFPTKLQLRYQRRRGSTSYCGEVINMSSTGVLFTATHAVKPGELVQLRIGWPALLDNGVPLNLVIDGEIVRAEQERAALEIKRYEFRTAPRQTAPDAAAGVAAAASSNPAALMAR